MVTGRRSLGIPTMPGWGAAASIARPHDPQNRNPSGTSAPQDGHVWANEAPHDPQNWKPSGFSNPHSGHLTCG